MSQSRKTKIQIRLTYDEKQRLEQLSKKYNKTSSELIREKVLNPQAKFVGNEFRKELDLLLKEARSINRTLNLYHEERQKNAPFLAKVRKFAKKFRGS